MKYGSVGFSKGQGEFFAIILVVIIMPSLVFLQDFTKKDSTDSTDIEWNQPFRFMKPSPVQLIQLRALQSTLSLHAETTLGQRAETVHPFTDFSQMYHDMDDSYFSYPGVEYRHGSNYIPQNVRDYTDYKMGRDRYLAVLNPILIGFILYNVTQYADYYFGEKDTQSLFSQLNRQQKQMLVVLQDNYPLNQNVWYALFQNTFPDSSISLKSFIKEINELEKLSLLKMRTFEDQEVRYFPAIQTGSNLLQLDAKK